MVSGLVVEVPKAQRAKFERILNRLAQAGARANHPLQLSANHMLDSVMKNFEQEGRPSKWRRWSEGYRQRRQAIKRPRGILTLGALLKKSIQVPRATSLYCLLSTNLIYAPTHQLGDTGRNIPARPFFLFQREDIPIIQDIFHTWFGQVMG